VESAIGLQLATTGELPVTGRIGSTIAGAALVLSATSFAALASEEVAIGEPVERNGLSVAAAYLEAIEMHPTPAMAAGEDVIHLECDIAATEGNVHGFSEGDWVPYLTCTYLVEKVGSDWMRVGTMLPMTAQDGPHYANNVPMDGPGEYRVTYHLEPPTSRGFFRHADDATGVEAWWEPFSVSWTFDYPAE
jgi:uncharacterized protein involved in high-affinity Fe2+ transport